jgi:hypothetical protein
MGMGLDFLKAIVTLCHSVQKVTQEPTGTSRLGVISGAILALPVLVFSALWLGVATSRPFWVDEIYSFWGSSWKGAGFPEIWQHLSEGRDGSTPLFVFLSWIWKNTLADPTAGIFVGLTPFSRECSLRIPSLLFVVAGSLVLLRALKITKCWETAFATVSLLLLGNFLVIAEASEFRGYGPVIGGAAWMWGAYLLWCRRPSAVNAAMLSGGMLILGNVHPLGVLFAGSLFLVMLIKHRDRLRALLLMAAPFVIVFLVSLPAVIAARHLTEPWNWIPVPDLGAFPEAVFSNHLFAWTWLGIVLGTTFSIRSQPACMQFLPAEKWTIILWLGVPFLLWLVSQFGTVLFLSKYFLPVWLVVSVLVSQHLSRAGRVCLAWVLVSGGVLFLAGGRAVVPREFNMVVEESPVPVDQRGEPLPVTAILTDSGHRITTEAYRKTASAPFFYYFDPVLAFTDGGDARRVAVELNLVRANTKTFSASNGQAGINPSSLVETNNFQQWVAGQKGSIQVFFTLDQTAWKQIFSVFEKLGWVPVHNPIPAGFRAGEYYVTWKLP